jgi:hypothetical protein
MLRSKVPLYEGRNFMKKFLVLLTALLLIASSFYMTARAFTAKDEATANHAQKNFDDLFFVYDDCPFDEPDVAMHMDNFRTDDFNIDTIPKLTQARAAYQSEVWSAYKHTFIGKHICSIEEFNEYMWGPPSDKTLCEILGFATPYCVHCDVDGMQEYFDKLYAMYGDCPAGQYAAAHADDYCEDIWEEMKRRTHALLDTAYMDSIAKAAYQSEVWESFRDTFIGRHFNSEEEFNNYMWGCSDKIKTPHIFLRGFFMDDSPIATRNKNK